MSRFALHMIQTVSALAVLAAAPAFAQWSSNPATNMAIADAAGAQNNPHVVAISGGGYYVSWFGAASTGFDVYLQHLDADGNKLWAPNGILVADRDFAGVQGYGLTVDSMGNAILAYRQKDANGVPQIAVQKVEPDGTFPVSLTGTFLTSYTVPDGTTPSDNSGAGAPMIAASLASQEIVAWEGPEGGTVDVGAIGLAKVNAYLFTSWTNTIPAPNGTGFNLIADMHKASGSAAVILSWSAQPSRFDRELWAQEISFVDGSGVWNSGNPVKVYDDADGALQYGYFPKFIPDPNGGAVFVWYTVDLHTATVRAQHLDSNGAPAFAQNGVVMSTDTTRLHQYPAGAYDATDDTIFAVWTDADAGTQSQHSLYAQSVDGRGVLRWGSEGTVLVPTGADSITQINALPSANGDLLAAWVSGDAPNAMTVHASRRAAADGSALWAQPISDIGTGPRTAGRLQSVRGDDGNAVFVWQAGTDNQPSGSEDDDIVGQILYPTGALQSDVIFKNGFDGQ